MKLQLIPLTLLLSISVFAQESEDNSEKIWATFNDASILPVEENGQLKSNSDDFQTLINTFNISSCVQILADSKKENLLKVYEITCDCNQTELMNALGEGFQSVSQIEAAPEYELLYCPDDYNLMFADDYALDVIGAQEAWDHTMGDPSVEIAISDSNYDLDHQELAGTVSYIGLPLTHPNIYHGTAVAITAAGNTDNGVGKSSIGGECSLQLYSMSYSNLLTATYNGAKVINVSWTSGCSYSTYYQEIVDEVYENGSIIVAAAGNGGTCGGPENYVYPASLNHVISVTSIGPTDSHERILGDPGSTHQHNDSVDICAPGYDVALSVVDGWYLTGNGTSFASPMVTGTIGLMLSVNPCLSFEDVEFILDSTSANIDMLNPSYAGKLGKGRLHAAKAVELAAEYNTLNYHLAAFHGCTSTEGIAVVVPIPGEGAMPFNVEWSTGDTTMMLENLEAGIYEVKVVDSLGCLGIKSTVVTTSEEILTASSVSEITCFGDSTGSINIEMIGGVGPFTYEWTTGSALEDVYWLPAGTYGVTITDSAECTKTEWFEIIEPSEIDLSFDVTSIYEEMGMSEIDLTVSGGTAPYSFDWSNGETTEDIVGLEAGMYSVMVTDENGCEREGDVEVFGPISGIASNDAEAFGVYPNPSYDGSVSVVWSLETINTIVINDGAGRLVDQINVNSNQKILNLEGLEKGVYFISLLDGTGLVRVKKLVVS